MLKRMQEAMMRAAFGAHEYLPPGLNPDKYENPGQHLQLVPLYENNEKPVSKQEQYSDWLDHI